MASSNHFLKVCTNSQSNMGEPQLSKLTLSKFNPKSKASMVADHEEKEHEESKNEFTVKIRSKVTNDHYYDGLSGNSPITPDVISELGGNHQDPYNMSLKFPSRDRKTIYITKNIKSDVEPASTVEA
mmetsp:Transcript_1760/g.2231  ORF Transcript_1760/g.2231 Transcript_1760/m.2231 type:complete len:127 (+) Transcript_1760:954-1334(+)